MKGLVIGGRGKLEYKEEEFKLFGRPRGGRRVLADNTANCQSQEQQQAQS